MISDYQRKQFDHEVEARLFNNKIIEPRFKEEVERNKIRVKYHQRLIVLNEILSDVLQFKALKDPESAIDYKQKLVYINERRSLIKYLNVKYGAGSKTFLEVLEVFKAEPYEILKRPDFRVKKLIKETIDRMNKQNSQGFDFKYQKLADMLQTIETWWQEMQGETTVKVDEVTMKTFI